MTARISVRFQPYGGDLAPTVEYSVRHWRTGSQLNEFALLDTGSSLTVFPRELLRQEGFPVARAKKAPKGIGGIGGRSSLFYLDRAAFALVDTDGAPHIVNLKRLHFTGAIMPTIVGRDLLRAMNARVSLDFADEEGYLEIG